MLIRDYDESSLLQQFFKDKNLGLPVHLLADAMKRDSDSINAQTKTKEPYAYIGNKCIKSTISL
jgi:hypothetical protein